VSEDICQTIIVDGDPILVRVTSLLTPEEVEAFAWVVRAAKRRYAAEQDDDLVYEDDEYPPIDDDVPMRDVVNAPVARDLL
jgi:hypothetical protein